MTAELYDFIWKYATEKKLPYTCQALPLIRSLMGDVLQMADVNIQGITRYRGAYLHALEVCKLLISVNLPLDKEEEDIVLAATLCHILPNKISYSEMVDKLLFQCNMDSHVCKIISLIINDSDLSTQGQKTFYKKILNDPLTVLVYLADRANLVKQLYTMSFWSANEYIFETRAYVFPMCIAAKEKYPALVPPINILMEKVRTMVDACAILLARYERHETELTEDILCYQEENARLRRIIRQIKTEREAASPET